MGAGVCRGLPVHLFLRRVFFDVLHRDREPDRHIRHMWNGCLWTVLSFTAIYMPFTLSFITLDRDALFSDGWFIVRVLLDIGWLGEILMQTRCSPSAL